MKYQFQFAGANVARPKPQQRRRMRVGLLVAAFALAALGYGYYLFNLIHPHAAAGNHAAEAVAVAAKPVASTTKAVTTTAAVAVTTATAQTLEVKTTTTQPTQAASSGMWSYLMETLKITKAAPVEAPHPQIISITEPAPQPETVAVSAAPTTASATTTPTAAKTAPQWRPLTAEQRLIRAGQVAMENMLVQATKYPGAYGFRTEDTFQQAKLGKAIPVYTISETDRAKYQPGQRVKPLLKSTGQWMFPVLSGDHIACMVKVKFNGHEYLPGDSCKSLADAWSVIAEKWPKEAGFHPELVVYSGMPGYYFTVPELAVPNITDTIKMTFYQPDVSPADVILASWR